MANINDKIGKQIIYIDYPAEDVKIRLEPGSKYFQKFPGKPEYQVDGHGKVFNDAILEGVEITKEEYEKDP